MKKTMTENEFILEMRSYDCAAHFSYAGLKAIFNYIKQLEQDTGIETEFDPIGLCVKWREETWVEIQIIYLYLKLNDIEELSDFTHWEKTEAGTIVYQPW